MLQEDIISIFIILLIVPLIFGIILGLKNKIVVFRNYDDLWIVFLSIIIPFVFFFVYAALPSRIVIISGCITEILLLVNILYRTFEDNDRNILKTILALYTKLPLSFLFIFQFVSYLENISKPAYKRSNGLVNIISILCLTPLILKLVKNKKGLFN